MSSSFALLSYCLCLAASLLLVHSLDPTLNDDVLGLIVFKAGLQDPNGKLQSWSQDDDSPCKWDGVTCHPRSKRVIQLNLNGFSLSGHVGRGLLQLQFLRVLSLSNNNFTGPINPDLASLKNLRVIDFSDNGLSGSIPDGFFQQCGSLRSVSFAKNSLVGEIPVSFSSCSTLVAVNFSYNLISGQVPSGLWSMLGVKYIDFSHNLLNGEIPQEIGSSCSLRVMNLGSNKITGLIPSNIGACLKLESIDFSHNSLFGVLPDSIRKLGSSNSLILRGNSFTGEVPYWIEELQNVEILDFSANQLSGFVPNSIGNLTMLKELNLSMNNLTGNLPDSMKNCENVSVLDVSKNQLTGNLPSWLFEKGFHSMAVSMNENSGKIQYPSLLSTEGSARRLKVLDLSTNLYFGEISTNIGVLSNLVFLNLSKNKLTGSIPITIGDLKTVDVIDLSDNLLNGTIPSEIGGAVSLEVLNLENNLLEGNIPSEIVNCLPLTSLMLSRNSLSGPIPAGISELGNLQYVDLSYNNLTGILPNNLITLSHLSMFNISHNHLQGELPHWGFFSTIPLSSVSGNPWLCGSVLKRACPSVHPKPIVLDPYTTGAANDSSTTQPNRPRKILLSISALIAIGAAAFIALGVIAVTLLNIRARSSMSNSAIPLAFSNGEDFSSSPTNDPNYGKLVMLHGDAEFVVGDHALLNKDCEIGRGGFGIVYRAKLQDGRSVAIKKLTVSSLMKSQDDFEREVRDIGKIRHHNLVTLEGYYWTPSLQLLIYEYVSSGSLYKRLHDKTTPTVLTWSDRFNIILGMARGLSHLHQSNIIHYNLKSTNVLIDDAGEIKVSDFGLARLLPMSDRCVLSSKIQSALGYMAPEFACRTVRITEKCDVYGFGILVLEVVTGRRPVEYMEDDVVMLYDMTRRALEDGRLEECVDEALEGNFEADMAIPVMKLGLTCASQVPSNRPDMEEVVSILELIQCSSEGQEEEEEELE